MHEHGSELHFSPTDLSHHLGCRHLTQLEAEVARGRAEAPKRKDPFLDSLIQRGNEHEAEYVQRLQAGGSTVVDLSDASPSGVERTLAVMGEGADLIVQAPIAADGWSGRADILRRTPSPTNAGVFYYEPIDTKLARETRAGTLLQLAAYAEMLDSMQGELPATVHVVTPLAEESYRTASVAAYVRFVKARLVNSVQQEDPATYPDPVPLCEVCRWWTQCVKRRRDDDHLSLVAGIHTLHVRELQRQQITTVTHLSGLSSLPEKPERGSTDVYDRLREQARLQVDARGSEVPPFELILPPSPGGGLTRLPAPSPGDVFLDFEGDPFVENDGLEYLTGWSFMDAEGNYAYQGRWAINRAEEKAAFEAFMDFVSARLDAHPDLHIYHFHHYEPAALKRLVGRYGTRADALDRLLRAERFIDLRAVVREGLLIGVERYGLKEMEPLVGYQRQLDLKDAGLARRDVELALEARDGASIDPDLRQRVTDYNREDCESTAALRQWLETRREDLLNLGHAIQRPTPHDGAPNERVTARDQKIAAVVNALLSGLPLDATERTDEEEAQWLLAQMLGYFQREEKCAWWEHFRLRDLDHDSLMSEREAVSGLVFDRPLPLQGRQKVPIHRYRFPPQETALDVGKKLRVPSVEDADDPKLGTVAAIDIAAGVLDIKKTGKTEKHHPTSVFREQVVPAEALEDSLLALGQHVASHGLVGDGPFQAARDLLLRLPPRRGATTGEPLRASDEDLLDAAKRLARELDGGMLPVQGPPGSGKSYSGARMIAALVADGRKVGVTAVSHKVITNLMDEVRVAAREIGITVRLVHQGGDEPDTSMIQPMRDPKKALAAIDSTCVVGGTAWLWSHDDAPGKLDYLFVDEAGQMALAQVLAASRATRNLVLLGDPQQLEQPRRGAHPDGAEVAALVHVLGAEQSTLTTEQGLFLDRTWRLHPSICAFTSEVYYDDRLQTIEGLDQQALSGPTRFAGSGLFLVEVEHEGNQSSSPHEVAEAVRVVEDLLGGTVTWTDRKGVERPLRPDDVLVVAPYNAQVAALRQALEKLGVTRVGTVDRFQGQEAPVVIYSCTSSTPEDAPRGMTFLYDPHRFNVATSRARCVVIVVASPRLFEPECRTPGQMAMANGLCRYRELASAPIASEDN